MHFMKARDSYLLFADFLRQYEKEREYYSGTVSIPIDKVEILVSYQIYTAEAYYYELEFMVVENGMEREMALDTIAFENRFQSVMFYFFFEVTHHVLYEGADREPIRLIA
jgi:hypothetical protein